MSDTENPARISTPSQPEQDWSQVSETVMMLNLAMAQIGRAMKEGDESVNSLTDAFTAMAENAALIAQSGKQLPESDAVSAILSKSESISSQVQSAIMAFQFYDKLSQRVNHVSHSLASLSQLISDPSRLHDPLEWQGLQESIRAKYPIEADKIMFDALLKGASVEEVLDLGETGGGADDEVELF